jgi:hypothetical protein
MKRLVKSVVVVGQVIGLLAGNNFTTPMNYVIAQHSNLIFY